MITYKNRKNTTYYLKVGTTKTGKPRYYASSNTEKGENASAMPEGSEFRENVNGKVSVGKIQPRYIHDEELKSIQPILDKLECAYRTEIKGKSIIINTSDVGDDYLEDSPFFSSQRAAREWMRETAAIYQPMLRFVLMDFDPAIRDFQTERMCFMSGMDDWLIIGEMKPLTQLAEKYIPLLDDHDALFEEIY